MPAFCEQEQNKYTTKVREYSVYGMVKVNLYTSTVARPEMAVRMSVMML